MKAFYAGGFLYNPKTKEVLLHKRDGKTKINPNKWAFFGGLNENNETPKETFIREVEEELGIKLSDGNIVHLCDYLNTDLDTYRYVFYAKSELNKNEMILGEGAGFGWIPLNAVFDYDLTDKTVNDLKIFIKSL